MAEPPQRSILKSLIGFLATKGDQGATLSEIYVAIRADRSEKTLTSTVRSTLYKKLVGRKNISKPIFERYVFEGQTRYRLLEDLNE
jgi:hypothetical protein